MSLLYISLAVVVLLVVAYTSVEIVVGLKRGGYLECFRLITVVIAAVISVAGSLITALVLIKPGFMDLPEELSPAAQDLAKAFAVPLVALVAFVLLKLISFIIYAIVKISLKKNHEAECANLTTKSKVLGVVFAVVISCITTGFLAMPTIRGAKLFVDYKDNEESIKTVYSLIKGEDVSSKELIATMENLTNYAFSVDYMSDEAKTKAINYAIEIINDKLKTSGNTILEGISFNTYESIEEHQEQMSAAFDIAKNLDNAGLLDDMGSSNTISEEKIFEAMSNEESVRDLVESVSKLDNGGEMLSDVINNTISEASKKEIEGLVNVEAMRNIDDNKEAIIQTLTQADCFKNLSEESYSQMSAGEKEELVVRLEAIKSYGMVNEAVCDDLIAKIKKSIGK